VEREASLPIHPYLTDEEVECVIGACSGVGGVSGPSSLSAGCLCDGSSGPRRPILA
jgi:hypothetical protein